MVGVIRTDMFMLATYKKNSLHILYENKVTISNNNLMLHRLHA